LRFHLDMSFVPAFISRRTNYSFSIMFFLSHATFSNYAMQMQFVWTACNLGSHIKPYSHCHAPFYWRRPSDGRCFVWCGI